MTKTAEAYEIVPQGSGGSALASGCVIAQGVEIHFSGSLEEISYGSVRLQPLSQQDDICRLAGSLVSTRAGNIQLAGMLDSKGLRCHPDKTVLLVLGTKKFMQEGKEKIMSNPIMLGDFKVKTEDEDVYLGDEYLPKG